MRIVNKTLRTLLIGMPLIFGCAGTPSKGIESKTVEIDPPTYTETQRWDVGRYQLSDSDRYVPAIEFTSASRPESPYNQGTYNSFGPIFSNEEKIEDALKDKSFDEYLWALNGARQKIPHLKSRTDSLVYSNPEPKIIGKGELGTIGYVSLGRVSYEFDGSGMNDQRIAENAFIGLYNAARQEVIKYNRTIYSSEGDTSVPQNYDPSTGKFKFSEINRGATSHDVDFYNVTRMAYDTLPDGRIRATGYAQGFNAKKI